MVEKARSDNLTRSAQVTELQIAGDRLRRDLCARDAQNAQLRDDVVRLALRVEDVETRGVEPPLPPVLSLSRFSNPADVLSSLRREEMDRVGIVLSRSAHSTASESAAMRTSALLLKVESEFETLQALYRSSLKALRDLEYEKESALLAVRSLENKKIS